MAEQRKCNSAIRPGGQDVNLKNQLSPLSILRGGFIGFAHDFGEHRTGLIEQAQHS